MIRILFLALIYLLSINNISAQSSLIKVFKVLGYTENNLRKDYSSNKINLFVKNRTYLLVEISDSLLYERNKQSIESFSEIIALRFIDYCNKKDSSFLGFYNDITISFIYKPKNVSFMLYKKSYKIRDLKNK